MPRQIRYLMVLFIALITIPYIFAWIRGGNEFSFGGFLINPRDGNTYLAKMYEGWRGEWSFTLPFTAEKGNGAFLFVFYLALGHLSRVTGISLILTFHIARVLSAVCLFISLYKFTLWIYGERPVWARRVFSLIVFGSGLGWLLIPFGLVTSDLWVVESFPFLSGFANPHFCLGIALLLMIFLDLAKNGSPGIYFRLALFSLLLSIIMPFGIVIAVCVGGVWLMVEWRVSKDLRWEQGLAAFLPGGLILIYQYLMTVSDPLLSEWNVQNLTPSPPVWDFLMAFSPAFVLAVWGIWRLVHEQPLGSGQRLLITWFITGIVLIYAPFALQRRFMYGYYLPVGLLAVEGLLRLPEISIKKSKAILFRVFLGLSIITNGLVVLITMFGVLSLSTNYYLTQDEMDAFAFIRSTIPENAIVLTSPEMGNYLPGWTGRRVIYGHEFETVNAVERKNSVQQFFSGVVTAPNEKTFLVQNHIGYIFIGNRERAIGTPALIADLQPVYQNKSVSIYAIQ